MILLQDWAPPPPPLARLEPTTMAVVWPRKHYVPIVLLVIFVPTLGRTISLTVASLVRLKFCNEIIWPFTSFNQHCFQAFIVQVAPHLAPTTPVNPGIIVQLVPQTKFYVPVVNIRPTLNKNHANNAQQVGFRVCKLRSLLKSLFYYVLCRIFLWPETGSHFQLHGPSLSRRKRLPPWHQFFNRTPLPPRKVWDEDKLTKFWPMWWLPNWSFLPNIRNQFNYK